MSALSQRLDKWLWHARITKTRTMAGRLVTGGKVRVNRARVSKAAHLVKPGDVITTALRGNIRVLRIEMLGSRRGPASEARELYSELTPPQERAPRPKGLDAVTGARPPGSGRPTKRQRRELEKFLMRG